MALEDLAAGLATSSYDGSTMTPEILAVYVVLTIVFLIGSYIYLSFAYQSIARKTKVKPAGIAWIPIVGPLIVASRASKKETWPIWLLLIGTIFFIVALVSEIIWISTVSLIVSLAALIAISVYSIFWHWYMFKTLKYPGWWSLFVLASSMGAIIHMTLLGIAAWLQK